MDAANLGNLESLTHFGPEILLGFAVVGVFLLDLVMRSKSALGDVALAVIAAALFLNARLLWGEDVMLFHRSLAVDGFALYVKLVILLAAFAVVWMSLDSREVRRGNQGEYYAILLSCTLGMLLMASATNLLMAYLSLEFVSLTSYVLAGYLRHSRRSGEAALKYLIYGGVASGAMIYGMSWIYGLAGSLDFHAIQTALGGGLADRLALFLALTLVLAGLGFKVAAFPFHMWAPDVYQGAPLPVTTFLAVGSKTAGFALMIRFFFTAMARSTGSGTFEIVGGVDWTELLLGLSMVTMTYGNLAALQQRTNLKRLLAYSSIAHAGYVLMGFVVLSDEGLRAMLFYLTIYYLMNVGAFLVVMVVSEATGGREDLASLRGLAWRGGAVPAVAMAIFMFSLTGLPPLAGYIGKFYLFAAVVQKGMYGLAIVGVLNSVISLVYYANVVKVMFLEQPVGGEGAVVVDRQQGVLLGLLTAATLILGVYWTPLFELVDRSTRFFVG